MASVQLAIDQKLVVVSRFDLAQTSFELSANGRVRHRVQARFELAKPVVCATLSPTRTNEERRGALEMFFGKL